MSPLLNQTSGGAGRGRPREVTLGGLQAVAGSGLALVLLISTAQQLNGSEMTGTLSDLVKNDQAAALNLTVENARRLLRYAIMGMSVLSAASLVLGVYVLRRHRAARIVLTAIGGVVATVGLLAWPVGWIVTVYIGVSIFLIWSRPARAWFSQGSAPGRASGPGDSDGWDKPGGSVGSGAHDDGSGSGGRSGSSGYGPPAGPRRDVDGVLPPPPGREAGSSGDDATAPPAPGPAPGDGASDGQPPPPPPPPRRR